MIAFNQQVPQELLAGIAYFCCYEFKETRQLCLANSKNGIKVNTLSGFYL
jgi:hypothetical protein